MIDHVRNIGLFLAANAAGFVCIPLTYHLSIALGLFTLDNAMLDSGALQDEFFMKTTYAWIACAVLSLGFFMFKEKGRAWFLALPIVLPMAYGLSVLVKLGALAS